MEFKLFLFVGAILLWNSVLQVLATSTEALLECGQVHQIDNIQNHSSASASYSNSQCMLVCVIGNVILPGDSIHEGHSCPEDTNGICRAGQCIGGTEDALHECGLKHHLDFHKIGNHQGTAFTNDQCTLRCGLGGDQLSATHLHEGSPCPANSNGVCRSGTCVAQSTNKATVTPVPPTTPNPPITTNPPTTPTPPTTPNQPITVTQPSINPFSPSKMKLLNISLESTDPSLNHDQLIRFWFYETHSSSPIHICTFFGNPANQNYCSQQIINEIPIILKKEGQMTIDMHDSGTQLTEQYENLYPLFDNFFQNHKLAFGEKENFVHKFAIYPRNGSQKKLMDVSLRFEIVFSV